MSDFEDKLNSILNSPDSMSKIMDMARSISGDGDKKSGADSGSSHNKAPEFDPKMLQMFSRIMGEYSSSDNDKAALLNAVKPYLKEDRHEKIDKAVNIAKLAHIAKIAFSEFGDNKNV